MRRASIAMAVLVLAGAPACGGGGQRAAEEAPTITGGDVAAGRRAFLAGTEPHCGDCHALRDAGTTSIVGTNLDETKPTFAQVLDALDEGPGAMPSYGGVDDAVKRDIAAYVEHATHEGG